MPLDSEPGTRVFLSYARKDSDFAIWLRDGLERNGVEVFRDVDDTLPGEEWWARLRGLITQADTIVFVLSPNSVSSKVCDDEVRHASGINKRIFPVVISEVEWSRVPEGLVKLHSIFFTNPDQRDNALQALLTALRTDLGWVRQHTALLERASAWQAKRRARSELLSGTSLEEAEIWAARQPKSCEPPTPLHYEYIRASRDAARQRRNYLIAALSCGLVLALALAGVALWQRGEAVANALEAVAQRKSAEAARHDAEKKRDEALRSESVALSSQALTLLGRGSVDLAFQMASKGLPRIWKSPDRPITEPALQALYRARTALLANSEAIKSVAAHDKANLTSVVLSRDGRHVATSGWDAAARVRDTETLTLFGTLQWYSGPLNDWFCRIVAGLAFSPDGYSLATANIDGKIRIFSTADQKLTKQFDAASDGAGCSGATWGDRRPVINTVAVCRQHPPDRLR